MMATIRRLSAILALALAPNPMAWAACDKPAFRVVIDVGHSAAAPGATSARGETEYSFNVRLTALIEHKLLAAGFADVSRLLTPGDVPLMRRAQRADALKPNLFLSIHHDSAQRQYLEPWTFEGQERLYSDRFKGWSLFVSPANDRARESRHFATLLADRLLAHGLGFSRHHAEHIPGENRPLIDPGRGIYAYNDLIVLKHSHAPAVLLESGVIINRDEEVALAGPERQNAISDAIVQAVEAFCEGPSR